MHCVFCDIINSKLPSNIVYEDDSTICILPKNMEVYGHILVIPKKHYENIFDIEKEDLSKFISIVQDMANNLKIKLGATGVNILNANGKDADQSVQHLHFHLFPRFENDGLDTWPQLPKKEFNKEAILNKLK